LAAEQSPGSAYAAAGVDIEAGDRAVELMQASVARTRRPEVIGSLGGFAGFFDASALARYDHPVLATSTDGVGTKVAIAQAMGRYDTIGFDLVGMLVDDLVVCGAEPLFVTDYIACGKVHPERIAAIRPDYVWILPWNLTDEIAAQLAYVREWGGRFVVAIPELRVFEGPA